MISKKFVNKYKLLIIITVVFLLLTILTKVVFNDPAPQFFPLNNPEGSYLVTKGSPCYQGTQKTTTEANTEGEFYCIEYESDNNGMFFRVMVGKSNIDLGPYVGKNIRIVDGEFVSSDQQCIVGVCKNINGSWIVLNIYDISELAN